MADSPSYEQLAALVERLSAQVVELATRNAELERIVAAQADEIAELKRRLGADSSNSSRPASSDGPWDKPVKKRSSRTKSGRQPGKQPGASSASRSLIDDPDSRLEIRPDRCGACDASLSGAAECGRQRRQVIDASPVPPPEVTEYQRVSMVCRCCGAVTTPGWDDPAVQIRNHYRGALAHGENTNQGDHTTLAAKARTLIRRFRRYEDMILRFAADLSVPFTNNEAERSCRPAKVQQRTSGGAWRTLQGLIDYAIVQSYLDTATKWGRDKLEVLHELFTTGAWLPPALTPAE